MLANSEAESIGSGSTERIGTSFFLGHDGGILIMLYGTGLLVPGRIVILFDRFFSLGRLFVSLVLPFAALIRTSVHLRQ
ncbi:uncharacterized protein ASPGLDRAFT_411924 [Aspergillus glaucus CBS 516.65]|uniref:Uncharacterized protein n=1 Tax=Aspergillus glaucus CBS 516.65 TaxID=1160497 RepID=A0A1L9VI02_ASPGL|nr:hypothetical protein ASPGLDRAFT_411924 [Aspergillus glaucus CBS 516.65]OJJ83561.1 hypothetical protein ASPGLDRAFT_411924 [Aspergillus glaucus CBS 516.65]